MLTQQNIFLSNNFEMEIRCNFWLTYEMRVLFAVPLINFYTKLTCHKLFLPNDSDLYPYVSTLYDVLLAAVP
jgi:hypothetical protein